MRVPGNFSSLAQCVTNVNSRHRSSRASERRSLFAGNRPRYYRAQPKSELLAYMRSLPWPSFHTERTRDNAWNRGGPRERGRVTPSFMGRTNHSRIQVISAVLFDDSTSRYPPAERARAYIIFMRLNARRARGVLINLFGTVLGLYSNGF